MTILVHHIDDNTAEVTLRPGWLARLFGARDRRGIAMRVRVKIEYGKWSIVDSEPGPYRWLWKTTCLPVDDNIDNVHGPITAAISCTPVEDIPPVRVEKRSA